MSDPQGPLSAAAEVWAHHAKLAPPQKSVSRTSYGSLILCAVVYTAVTLGPDAAHSYPPAVLLGFAGAVLLGLRLVVNGIRGPRGPIEPMSKTWALLLASGFTAGSWWLAGRLPDWWDNFYLRGFCIAFTAAQWIDFLLLLRAPPPGARPLVDRNIAENEFTWE